MKSSQKVLMRSMKPVLKMGLFLFLFVGIFNECIGQKTDTLKIENGVSESLAAHRKAIIGNLQYELPFSIPALKDHTIAATETIRFNWKQDGQPLQIDFKESNDQLQKVEINGSEIATDFREE